MPRRTYLDGIARFRKTVVVAQAILATPSACRSPSPGPTAATASREPARGVMQLAVDGSGVLVIGGSSPPCVSRCRFERTVGTRIDVVAKPSWPNLAVSWSDGYRGRSRSIVVTSRNTVRTVTFFEGLDAVWTHQINGLGDLRASALVADTSGTLVLGGLLGQHIQYGSLRVDAIGGDDAFVLAVSGADGKALWSRTDGGPKWATTDSFGVMRNRDPVALSSFHGTAEFGRKTIAASGGGDVVVSRLLADTGAVRWAQVLASNGQEDGRGIAVDAKENILVLGSSNGDMVLPGRTLRSSGQERGFVAKLTGETGHVQWVRELAPSASVLGIAAGPTGEIYVVGSELMTVRRFGKREMAFVHKYSAAGTLVWKQLLTSNPNSYAAYVNVRRDGRIVVAGPFGGQLKLGSTKLYATDSAAFIALLRPDGEPEWIVRTREPCDVIKGIAMGPRGLMCALLGAGGMSEWSVECFSLHGESLFVRQLEPIQGNGAAAITAGPNGSIYTMISGERRAPPSRAGMRRSSYIQLTKLRINKKAYAPTRETTGSE